MSAPTTPKRASTVTLVSPGGNTPSSASRKSVRHGTLRTKARVIVAFAGASKKKSEKRATIANTGGAVTFAGGDRRATVSSQPNTSREYTMQGILPGIDVPPVASALPDAPTSKIMGSILARRRMYSLTRKALNKESEGRATFKMVSRQIQKSVHFVNSEIKATGVFWQAACERQIKREMSDLVNKMSSGMDLFKLLEELEAISVRLNGMAQHSQDVHIELDGIEEQLTAIENQVISLQGAKGQLEEAIANIRTILELLLLGNSQREQVWDKIRAARIAEERIQGLRNSLKMKLEAIGNRNSMKHRQASSVEAVVDFMFALPPEDRLELDRVLFSAFEEDGSGKHAILLRQAVDYSLASLNEAQRADLALDMVSMDDVVEACQARAWRNQVSAAMDQLMEDETKKVQLLNNLIDRVQAIAGSPKPLSPRPEMSVSPTSKSDRGDSLYEQGGVDARKQSPVPQTQLVEKTQPGEGQEEEEEDEGRHSMAKSVFEIVPSSSRAGIESPEPRHSSRLSAESRGGVHSLDRSPELVSPSVNETEAARKEATTWKWWKRKVSSDTDEDRCSPQNVLGSEESQTGQYQQNTDEEARLQPPVSLPLLDVSRPASKPGSRPLSRARTPGSVHAVRWEPLEQMEQLTYRWQEMQLQRQRACGRTKDWLRQAKVPETRLGSIRLPACISRSRTGFDLKTPQTSRETLSSTTLNFPPLLFLANELVSPRNNAALHHLSVSSIGSERSWDPGLSTCSWMSSRSLRRAFESRAVS